MSDEPAVLWLDAITETDRPRVGAKAFTLARLRQRGFPVPDGFVLPAGMPVGAAAAAYAQLGGALAVRSSSTAEDTAEASFAGQYRTVLGVVGEDALREAIRLCRESSSAATAYAQALGAAAGSMAVLVQRMVAPQAAGVVFTEDPRDPTALLVEAHPGLGEAVVSGSTTPDRYVLDRTSGALRDDGRPAAGCLDEPGLRAVVELARRVETTLGAPQDVEWALVPGGPVLLQARPITVEASERPDPHLRRLTRANVGEVLPDPVTPLTWSTVGTFLEHGFRGVAEEAGLVTAGTGPFLVLYRRRLYMNLSLCVDVARRLPGVTAADAERLILGGGAAGAPPPLTALPLIAALPRLLRVGVRLLGLARRLPARVLLAEGAVRGLPTGEVLEHAGQEALARYLDVFAQRGRELAFTHVAASGSCGFRLALLGALLGRLAPGDIEGRVNRLVTGLANVASTAPTFALEALAEEVSRHEGWAPWLKRAAARPSAAGVLADAPPALADGLRGFLQRFGHRAVSEGELAAPARASAPRSGAEAPGPRCAAPTKRRSSPASVRSGGRCCAPRSAARRTRCASASARSRSRWRSCTTDAGSPGPRLATSRPRGCSRARTTCTSSSSTSFGAPSGAGRPAEPSSNDDDGATRAKAPCRRPAKWTSRGRRLDRRAAAVASG